jgi:hypothetical protein
MQISRIVALTASVIAFLALPAAAQDDWVQKSNAHAQIVLEAVARFNPETAGSIGVDGLDEEILDLREGLYERDIEDSERVLEELHLPLTEESHPAVRQDLGILIKVIEDSIHTTKLNHEYMLPYRNISQTIFGGIRGLIDPQIPAERYPAAIVRLNRYAGLENGYEPIVELAKDRMRERRAREYSNILLLGGNMLLSFGGRPYASIKTHVCGRTCSHAFIDLSLRCGSGCNNGIITGSF